MQIRSTVATITNPYLDKSIKHINKESFDIEPSAFTTIMVKLWKVHQVVRICPTVRRERTDA
jgi:hypothetical protein